MVKHKVILFLCQVIFLTLTWSIPSESATGDSKHKIHLTGTEILYETLAPSIDVFLVKLTIRYNKLTIIDPKLAIVPATLALLKNGVIVNEAPIIDNP